MSNNYIFVILLILTLIILYGGQNKQKLVIYNNEYFCFIKNMEDLSSNTIFLISIFQS